MRWSMKSIMRAAYGCSINTVASSIKSSTTAIGFIMTTALISSLTELSRLAESYCTPARINTKVPRRSGGFGIIRSTRHSSSELPEVQLIGASCKWIWCFTSDDSNVTFKFQNSTICATSSRIHFIGGIFKLRQISSTWAWASSQRRFLVSKETPGKHYVGFRSHSAQRLRLRHEARFCNCRSQGP